MHTIRQKAGHGGALAGPGGFFSPLQGLLSQVGRLLVLSLLWRERARQRHALAELDDRMLKDIGLSQAEVSREIAKPFWQG